MFGNLHYSLSLVLLVIRHGIHCTLQHPSFAIAALIADMSSRNRKPPEAPHALVSWQANFDRILKTMTEMLCDRGYTQIEYKAQSEHEVNRCIMAKRCVLSARHKSQSAKVCQVIFLRDNKLGVNHVREFEEVHNCSKTHMSFIIVASAKATHPAIKYMSDRSWISDFVANQVLHNVTRHCLVPKHELLPLEEHEALFRRFGIEDKPKMLPEMLHTDPIAKYHNFDVGDIVKVYARNGYTEMQLLYVRVIRAA